MTIEKQPVLQRGTEQPLNAAAPANAPAVIIQPSRGWVGLRLRELWAYRELLYFLIWRDVKVRYKQTILGAAWAVIQPLAQMIVFTLFLGRLANVTGDAENYPLFVFAGLLPWTLFAGGIASASGSVVGSQQLVTKVYFPRLIIPMGAVVAGVVDFAIGFVLLLAMIPFFPGGASPGWGILFVPVLTLGLLVASLGFGTLLAALVVAYRDVRYIMGFLMQLWMFATPTIYLEADKLPVGPTGRSLLPLNPAYGYVYNFRQAVLGGEFDYRALLISTAVSLVMLVVGCLYFRRVERSFADII
jgi:homopolymeric O-antigen transport system permease protein